MRILQVHNRYQYRSGEDQCVGLERQLLESRGHEVVAYQKDNRAIEEHGVLRRATLLLTTSWQPETVRDVQRLVGERRPDVAHVHNVQPLVSPSVYWALDRAGVPIVQTIHNFRMFCPAGTFMRDGRVCEACVTRSLWQSIRHACFRDSRVQTYAVAQALWVHRLLGTWRDKIDVYVALNEFGRDKLIENGVAAEKVAVKTNFVASPPTPRFGHDGYAVFLGRLSPEKGLDTLLDAWRKLPEVPLRIIGDGPVRAEIERRVAREALTHVTVVGTLAHHEAMEQVRGARFLVFPSIWYETQGQVILEAYACGKPVLASRLGAMTQTVVDGVTGHHFAPGDAADLVAKARLLLEGDRAVEMGKAARRAFEAEYTESRNHDLMMEIYERAIAVRKERALRRPREAR